MRLADADSPHLTNPWLAGSKIIDEADSVNLRCLRREASFPKQLGLFGRPLDQNGEFLSNKLFVSLPRDLLLQRHKLAFAVINCAIVDFPVEFEALAGF